MEEALNISVCSAHPVVFTYLSYFTTFAEHAIHCLAFGLAGTCWFVSVQLDGQSPTIMGGVKTMARVTLGHGKKYLSFIEPLQKTFAYKECKIAPQKSLFFSAHFALLAGFFWYRCYYPHRSRDALSPVCGILYSNSNIEGSLLLFLTLLS